MATEFRLLTRSGFDLDLAILLAEASQVAYSSAADSNAWASAQGFTAFKFFDRSDVQGFWCTAENVALLCFRGTSDTAQWLRNARFVPVSYPWGRVHSGFRNGVEGVESDLLEFDAVIANAGHVWITGHSSGAALALIAAARLKMKGISASLYTYGQPRVGLSGFADRFAIELPSRLIRFVNQSDVVTRVPPGFLFRHTGIVKRIVEPGVLETELESPAAMSASAAGLSRSVTMVSGISSMESAQAVEDSGLTKPMLIETEPAPLTEEQFAVLQMALGGEEATSGLSTPQLEGALPFIGDHAISEYIRLLTEIRG